MGEYMKTRIEALFIKIFPFKRVNIFTSISIIMGVTLGSIFAKTITLEEANMVSDKIRSFISNSNSGKVSLVNLFVSNTFTNYIYIFLSILFGFTIIGIIISFLLLFIRSFIMGFTLTSFIVVFKYRGLFLSIGYLLCGGIINIFYMALIFIYSYMFIKYYILNIKDKDKYIDKFRRLRHNYLILILFIVLFGLISSVLESFLFPSIIRVLVKFRLLNL